VNDPDILHKLNRILAMTPDTAFAVPQMDRRTLLAAATEIRSLREQLAQRPQPADDTIGANDHDTQ
jgi:hypothetical protein